MNPFPDGVWPVMLTPFTESNEIDEDGLHALVEFYLSSGVDGLFAACQSSEIHYLAREERLKILEVTLQAVDGRVPVIASGHVSDDLKEQADELNAAWALGADAVILISNRLAKFEESSEVWIRNLKRLLDMLDPAMKLGMYECPQPYKRVLSRDELQAMIDTGRFYFLKDTCRDAKRIADRLKQFDGTSLKLFNANVTTLLESLHMGAAGFCGVMANFHPEMYVWLTRHIDHPNADQVQMLMSVTSLIEYQAYPANAKWSLSHLRGVPIGTLSRSIDDSCLIDAYKQEITHVESLMKEAYQTYCL